MEVTSEQLFTEVEVTSEQLFTDSEVSIFYISIYTQGIFVILFRFLKFVNKLGSSQVFCFSITISASLVKLRRRIMFENKTLLWKHPNQISLLSLHWLGWLSHFWNLNFALTFRKPWLGRNFINFVYSLASQKYPRIFLDREPSRAREKHYSLVWYVLINNYPPKWRWLAVDNCFSICPVSE